MVKNIGVGHKLYNEKMIYIISYDLKNPGQDYTSLYEAIKSCGDWQHPLESMWFLSTNSSADNIYNIIKPCLDNNDLLFISELNVKNRQGWMAKSCWDWINSHIN